MTAVENCIMWSSLKALQQREREKLLAAGCLSIQEIVELVREGDG